MYVNINNPAPAVDALKFVPDTPVPLYTPPAGVPPVSAYVLLLLHCSVSVFAQVTTGNAFTVNMDELDTVGTAQVAFDNRQR